MRQPQKVAVSVLSVFLQKAKVGAEICVMVQLPRDGIT